MKLWSAGAFDLQEKVKVISNKRIPISKTACLYTY